MKGICVILLVMVAATAARADDFTDACMLGTGPGTDMARTCACMSPRIPTEVRADATEALRRIYKAMMDTSKPIDPSALPPNLMRGLQATEVAQAYCL